MTEPKLTPTRIRDQPTGRWRRPAVPGTFLTLIGYPDRRQDMMLPIVVAIATLQVVAPHAVTEQPPEVAMVAPRMIRSGSRSMMS